MQYQTSEIIDLLPNLPEDQKEILIKAADFAKKAHEGQLRKSGEPYYIHVFETAKNLATYEMDVPTIAAGFLHDVLEDTQTTEEEMTAEFGEEICTLVKGVTKLGHVRYQGRVRHAESLRKLLMATAHDHRVIVIKLADRLHNLRTLEHVNPEKRARIAIESIEIYAPLADRLGIGRLKGEIEDAAFPFAFPEEQKLITKILEERSEQTKKSLDDVYKKITVELEQSKINVKKINYRIKHAYSLWRKMQKNEMNIEKIYDLVALRIIVGTVEECYTTLGIIHSLWQPMPGRIKDYIALPKFNGYQSLHTTVFTGEGGIVEIQIRTEEMHVRAELGIASHYQYKKTTSSGKIIDKKFHWINEFKDLEKAVDKPNDFLNELKGEFFNNQIFAFTPKGDVIDLPSESTPIDFAYAIHSDLGDKVFGAKINGKMVPIGTQIKSGQIVEIITKKDGTPKEKWLSMTKTNMAKRKIKQYLNDHKEESLFTKYFQRGSK
jgi:guanosine-3',5'-bis(diphosphate) 3'-pyrophosphohydrolase